MTFRNGFSIVELMVALLLGSLIAIAATQLFLVNRQTSNLQQGIASVQDQGRFALDYISRDLMQAGHDPAGAVQPFVFTGDTDEISKDGTKYDPIAFQVREGFDCIGSNTPYSGVKIYYVDDHKLRCSYTTMMSGRQYAESIIDGVEALQVQYGIDYDDFGQTGYGQADVYTNATAAKDMITATSKKRIVSVRFALLLSSPGIVSTDTEFAPASSIQVLDRTYNSGTATNTMNLLDGRLYRVFSSTVTIRNQINQI